MANIIDYVEWRGDLNLNKTEFNEIDSLILNRFSYFPLDNLINKNEMVSIKELSERFKKADKKQMTLNLWRILFSRLKNTEVGNYERINSASLSILHKFLKMRNFIIAWKCVASHMDSCTLFASARSQAFCS